MRRALALAPLLLAACGPRPAVTPPPVLDPVEVFVPVATSCVPPNLEPAPEYPDNDAALLAASDAAERYQLLWAGRKVRVARLSEIETVVAGCVK